MQELIKKRIKTSPFYLMYKNLEAISLKTNPDKYLNKKYKGFYGENMNFSSLKKLSEKIQLLKFYDYPERRDVVEAADKYTLHHYLHEIDLEYLSVPYIHVYENISEFDLKKLPRSFVLKKTNASELNLIVKDKNNISEKKIKQIMKRWFKFDYGIASGEPHYSKAVSRIICEPFFADLGNEYRFFMVAGEIGFIQVIVWEWDKKVNDSQKHDDSVMEGHGKHYRLHFDENWQLYWKDEDTPNINVSKPHEWEKLKHISKKIARDFPIVRVDFNEINGEIKITELTFTPASGYLEILKRRPDIDIALGKKLRIED